MPPDRDAAGGGPAARGRFDLPGLAFAGMSQAVRDGELVVLSGQVALDASGEVVGEGDWDAQAEAALANLEAALAAAGARSEDVVKLTCFLTDAAGYAAYSAAKNRRFEAVAPASTCVVVAGLLDPRLLLEVEAIALVRP
jgi:enamine deaminase RidA (YjgF/YER057c/UK114 family)